MIRINLLGDALAQTGGKKGDRAEQPVQVYTEAEGAGRTGFPIAGVGIGLVGVLLAGGYYLLLNNEVTRAKERKAALEEEDRKYAPYNELEAQFRAKKEALQKKEEVILSLKRQQQLPVHLLEELANSLPDDVWFRRVSQSGNKITIEGDARNFEAINQFYGNLQARNRWFKHVNYPGGVKNNNVVSFSMSFDLENAV